MKNNELLRVVVAESSMILRTGVVNLLKRIPDRNILPVEVVSPDALNEYMRLQYVDVLIVDPVFGGWFDVETFKESILPKQLKCLALVCSVVDSAILKGYDETMSVFETVGTLTDKLNRLQHIPADKTPSIEPETLSQREREIIVCVVKGMTNKTIADKLFLSIHTVITHRRNIARKLQIHSSAGLTIYAIVNKLVELREVEEMVGRNE